MRHWCPFLPIGKSWIDAPYYCNLNIPYLSSILYRKVYCLFRLCFPFLFCLCGICHLSRTPFLWTASSFAKLSCFICWGVAGSVDGSLGIGCRWWWNHFASPLLGFRVGWRSASGKIRKGSALWSPCVQLSVMPPSMKRRFVYVAPVPYIKEVPCVVASLWLLSRPLLSCWTACNTACWTAYLVWMRRSQDPGC